MHSKKILIVSACILIGVLIIVFICNMNTNQKSLGQQEIEFQESEDKSDSDAVDKSDSDGEKRTEEKYKDESANINRETKKEKDGFPAINESENQNTDSPENMIPNESEDFSLPLEENNEDFSREIL